MKSYTEDDFNSRNYLTRFKAYEALGWIDKAKNDPHREIRVKAYEALGWTEEAFQNNDYYIRLQAYNKLGFKKNALSDIKPVIVNQAKEYFKNCKEILGLKSMKYRFTKKEAKLLNLNGLIVNKNIIDGEIYEQ